MRIVLFHEDNAIREIAIPPHDIYVSGRKPTGPALNRYTGQITEIVPFRSLARIRVLVGGNSLLTEVLAGTLGETNLEVRQDVHVIVKLRRLRCFEAEG